MVVSEINSKSTIDMDLSTFTAPSVYSSRITVNSGGYKISNKKVYVRMKCTTGIDITSTSRWGVAALPTPSTIDAPLIAFLNTTGVLSPINCGVNKDSSYLTFSSSVTIPSGTIITVTGYYYID